MLRRLFYAFFLSLAAQAAQAAPMIPFGNQQYQLAFTNQSEQEDLNEYIPPGQTLESWTHLIALHVYHQQAMTPEEFAARLVALVNQTAPNGQARLVGKNSEGHMMVDFMARPSDKAFIEYNIFKFKQGERPGDIIGYQYALRDYHRPPSAAFSATLRGAQPLIKAWGETPYPAYIPKAMTLSSRITYELCTSPRSSANYL